MVRRKAQPARTASALAGLEAAIRLVDDIDAPLAPDETIVPVPVPERSQ